MRWYSLSRRSTSSDQKAPPLAGELSVSDSEQTEGEQLTALGSFKPFPFRHGSRRDTNAGWNMVVLQRCRLQYSLFRPILPSLHRPLGALGSNPPHAGTAFGWRCHQPALKGEVDMSVSEWTEGL